jgi:maleylpyruvate isomerase
MKITLHNYWRSSASHRVRIALGLKGLAYEYVGVNILEQQQHGDAHKARAPMAQVPALVITEEDGKELVLSQSLAIIEFLEERFPETALLPKEPFGRARVRALAEIVNSGIQPLQNLSVMKAVTKFGGDASAWPQPFLAHGLAAYEALVADTANVLGAGKFSVGDRPTIADCCLVPQLVSARRFGVDYKQHAHVSRIEEACMALDAFKNAMPDQQPDAVRS